MRALALINLGIAEAWAGRLDQAQWHLEQGIALAHRTVRPYLEFTGLAHQAGVEAFRSLARAEELGRRAVELAERHGWTDDPAAGAAYVALASALVWQGRIKEAEGWVQHAERTGRPEADPAANMGIRYVRALLELRVAVTTRRWPLSAPPNGWPGSSPHRTCSPAGRGRCSCTPWYAWASWSVPGGFSPALKSKTANAGRSAPPRRRCGSPRMTRARRPLGWRRSSRVQLPFPGGSGWLMPSCWRRSPGRHSATRPPPNAPWSGHWMTEPDGALMAFLLQPAPGLLERHARDCPRHAALISEILSLLPAEPEGYAKMAPPRPRGALEETARLIEPLSRSEVRVLRYLPTNLSAPEVARELSLSVHTVRTHMRHIFAKLGVHRRTEVLPGPAPLACSPHPPRALRRVMRVDPGASA